MLRNALPVAGCIIEFIGGPGGWSTRVFSAARNMGATVDGRPLAVSRTKELSKALIVSGQWRPYVFISPRAAWCFAFGT